MPLLLAAIACSLSACAPNGGPVLETATPATTLGYAPASDIALAAVSDANVHARDRDIAAREIAKAAAQNGTISGSQAIDALIEKHARENDIPVELAYGVVRVESRFNPKAKGAGVYGLSQIMPATARSLGFSGSASDLLDADTNLRYGMKYLAGAWEKSGRDVCRTAMKYKGGHRATRMTRSASNYCSKVKAQMAEIAKRGGHAGIASAAHETSASAATTPRVEAAAASVRPQVADNANRHRKVILPVASGSQG